MWKELAHHVDDCYFCYSVKVLMQKIKIERSYSTWSSTQRQDSTEILNDIRITNSYSHKEN